MKSKHLNLQLEITAAVEAQYLQSIKKNLKFV
jgi:hypothetical protein